MEKEIQRNLIKEKLKSLENKDGLDDKIFENLVNADFIKGNVLIYNSLKSEVSTKKIVDYYMGKVNLYMPKVIGDDMVYVKLDKNTVFEVGPFNIKEPIGKEYLDGDILFDVCITPLLGYDKALNRLGKGKGYYDRFFSKQKNCLKVGLAYTCQEVDKIQAKEFDVKLDYIVNEFGVITCE